MYLEVRDVGSPFSLPQQVRTGAISITVINYFIFYFGILIVVLFFTYANCKIVAEPNKQSRAYCRYMRVETTGTV
jgi:hypothetical protein